MPNHKLGSIKSMIKTIIPFSELIVGSKYKQITSWFENAKEVSNPFFRLEIYPIPFCHIIINSNSPSQRNITSRMLANVVGGIRQDEIYRFIWYSLDKFLAIPLVQDLFSNRNHHMAIHQANMCF